MACRAQAALWIACVLAALAIVPASWGSPAALHRFELRTEALYELLDPRAAGAARAMADAFTRRLPALADDEALAAHAPSRRVSIEQGIGRWCAWWRIVASRLALLAGVALAGLPLVAAGVVDGIAMRRARLADRAAGSPVAAAMGAHMIVALLFAPFLWCTLPLSVSAEAVALWLAAVTAAAAFTLSRAPQA